MFWLHCGLPTYCTEYCNLTRSHSRLSTKVDSALARRVVRSQLHAASMSALVIGKRPCVPACRSSQVIAPLRTRQAAQALRFTRVSERATRSVHCRVEAPDLTKDDMGDLAEKIQEVAKSVDEGLQVCNPVILQPLPPPERLCS